MHRRDFLKGVGLGAAAVAGLPEWALSAQTKGQTRLAGAGGDTPNFVVIMADDIGPEYYGCYGNEEANTPHLDEMARTGVVFRTCWATPICSPTRAMIMTGRYAHRTGWYHNALKIPHEGNRGDFKKNNLVFSRILKRAGYATAIAGKWQVHGRIDDPAAGFDEYCWHFGGMGPGGIKRDAGIERFAGLFESQGGEPGWGPHPFVSRYWGPGIIRNGELVPTTPEDFGPDIFTDFLIDFIRRHKDRPFLAYYPMVLTHGVVKGGLPTTPLSGGPGKLTGGTLQGCNDSLDLLVGRIVEALEELGLRQNTIVIYTSDNPGQGRDKVWAKNSATEYGARVPLIINGPGIVEAKGASDELVSLVDITPTLVEFAGAELPDGYELDGTSLAPYLRGQTEEHREWLYSYLGTARMLRDKRWLLEGVDEAYDSPRGRFYDCGANRDPKGYGGYEDVTDSTDPEVLAARKRFDEILAELPAPDPSDPTTSKILQEYDGYIYRHRLCLKGK